MKFFFPSLNMYQAKSSVKIFSLYWGGGSLCKNFFSSLNMYQAKSGVKNFSLNLGGSLCKIFFFQSEHVSQDPTFLHLVGLPYRSSRLMWWAHHPNVHGRCLRHLPSMVAIPGTTPAGLPHLCGCVHA